MADTTIIPIETHPFEPWLPHNARLLMLGTFPPSSKRWCMAWYYPNFTNDMWRIFGYIFFGDKMHFVKNDEKTYNLESLKLFLEERGIAIFDTCLQIRRLKNTASDKELEVVKTSNLDGMLRLLPDCKAVIAAGQLATKIFTEHYGIKRNPKMGEYVEFMFEGRTLKLYRMPSSSRAYPMRLEKKAIFYEAMFKDIDILKD